MVDVLERLPLCSNSGSGVGEDPALAWSSYTCEGLGEVGYALMADRTGSTVIEVDVIGPPVVMVLNSVWQVERADNGPSDLGEVLDLEERLAAEIELPVLASAPRNEPVFEEFTPDYVDWFVVASWVALFALFVAGLSEIAVGDRRSGSHNHLEESRGSA